MNLCEKIIKLKVSSEKVSHINIIAIFNKRTINCRGMILKMPLQLTKYTKIIQIPTISIFCFRSTFSSSEAIPCTVSTEQ